MVTPYDESLMHQALYEAWKYQGLTFPNPAVGALVCDEKGEILALSAHQKAGEAHAEVLALKEAYQKLTCNEPLNIPTGAAEIHAFLSQNHRDLFKNCTLYVTLEPCNHYGKTPPCSQLIRTLGLKKVVIGSYDQSPKAKGGGEFLREGGVEVVFGCLQKECDELLSPFLCQQAHKPFVFFKLALSKNNVATGGIISSLASRTMVHRLRDRCDLLVIGGNTVRIDRPILDARLCNGKAPDVLIYSHQRDFDRSIPLFLVPYRTVLIEDHLTKINDYSMVMIEGAEAMLRAVRSYVRWYLIFHSPHLKEGIPMVLPPQLRHVFSQSIGEDVMSWYYDDGN